MSKVVVIGSLNYDVVLQLKELPKKGETLPAQSAKFCAGGKGANQAVQLAKLGVQTYMVGAVGSDAMGNYMKENLDNFGVNTDFIKVINKESGMGIIQALGHGEVYATIVRGANYGVTKEDVDRIAPLLKEADFLVMQLEIPVPIVEYAIDLAYSHHCKVILNAAPAMEISRESLKKCYLLVVNEVEAAFYIGKELTSIAMAKEEVFKLAQELQNNCLFTLGKDGGVVSDGKRVEFVPAIDVKVVETTGAGDSFVGGMAYALANQQDVFEASLFASYCSAGTIGGIGAQTAMPTLEKTQQIMKEFE